MQHTKGRFGNSQLYILENTSTSCCRFLSPYFDRCEEFAAWVSPEASSEHEKP